MLFYLLFALCVTTFLLLDYFSQEENKVLRMIAFILVVCVAGLREYVGSDFDDYVSIYTTKANEEKLEFGFVAIMDFLRFFGFNYNFLFFFFSFSTCLFVYLGIKKYTSNVNFALLIFVLIPGLYLNSFSILRQIFAVAVSFYAFYYLLNKRYLLYGIFMFIGISVHYTCIIPLILQILAFKYIDILKKPRLLFILLLCSLGMSQVNLIALLGNFFEEAKYAHYFIGERVAVNIYKIIVLNFVAIIILGFFKRMQFVKPSQKYFTVFYLFSVIFTNTFASIAELTRIAYYFKIFEIVCVVDFVYLFNKHKRVWIVLLVFIYYLSVFLFSLKTESELETDDTKLTPYKSVFSQS